MVMIHATEKEAKVRTWVIWDIKTCLVPPEFDASWVGPCIKRALKNLGYNGDVTITAIGILTDLPLKLLQSVSSTGIILCHTPFDALSIVPAMLFRPVNFLHLQLIYNSYLRETFFTSSKTIGSGYMYKTGDLKIEARYLVLLISLGLVSTGTYQ